MIKNHQKKRLTCYILLIFVLSVLQGKAQASNEKGGLRYGIKGGLNISSLSSNFIGLPDLKMGFQVGGFATYGLNSLISAEVDVLYANLGSSNIDPAKLYVPGTPGANNIIKSSVKMNTLEIPILVNCAFDLSGIKTRFIIGPEMNFYLSSSAVNTRVVANGETVSKTDVSASFQSSDIAIVVGIGIDLQESIGVDLRYRTGLDRVNYIRSRSFSDFGLNALSLNIGYSF